MDPTVITRALIAYDQTDGAAKPDRPIPDLVQDLCDWLDRGGFIPDDIDDAIVALHDQEYIHTAACLIDVLNERRGLPT